jgi:hypothetical protein
MAKRKEYSGPATLCFADGEEVSVNAQMQLVRSFFSEVGEGVIETDSDTAARVISHDHPLVLDCDGERTSIHVRETKIGPDSARCIFEVN